MHDVIDTAVSRRALLRGASLLGAGAALGGLPLGARAAFARDGGIAAQWPTVTAMLDKYVSSRKLAGMAAAIGWGTNEPGFIARGKEGLDDPDVVGPDSLSASIR